MENELLNLSDRETKRRLIAAVSAMQGIVEVTIKPVRMTRRQRANRFYFGCVVDPVQQYLTSQGQFINKLEAHDLIKMNVLPKDVFDPRTHDLIGTIPGPSRGLSIPEFAEFTERAIHYVGDMFNIEVANPDAFFGKEDSNHERARRTSRPNLQIDSQDHERGGGHREVA